MAGLAPIGANVSQEYLNKRISREQADPLMVD
jgi:hypothetical protein